MKDAERQAKIAEGCRYRKFLAESPVVIVACRGKKASPHWYIVDAAIALENLVLAATALELRTC